MNISYICIIHKIFNKQLPMAMEITSTAKSMDATLSHHSEDPAASAPEASSQDLFAQILDEIKDAALLYSDELGSKPLCKATAYDLCIAMLAEIAEKIMIFQEKRIVFPKKIIEGLWEVETPSETVNVIFMLLRFWQICGNAVDANGGQEPLFKRATYGSIIARNNGQADLNYNIKPDQAKIPLKDSKFVLLFKVFRSIVGRSISHCTGAYTIPNPDICEKWQYRVQNGKVTETVSVMLDPIFYDYICDVAEIYALLENFSPSLNELYVVFNEAIAASKIEIANKMEAKSVREALRASRSKSNRTQQWQRKHQRPHHVVIAVAPATRVAEKVDWKAHDNATPPQSRWKKPVAPPAVMIVAPVVNAPPAPTPVPVSTSPTAPISTTTVRTSHNGPRTGQRSGQRYRPNQPAQQPAHQPAQQPRPKPVVDDDGFVTVPLRK